MALQEQFEKQGDWLFKYRSFLPLIIIFMGISISFRTDLYPEEFRLRNIHTSEIYYELIALIISLLGLSIRMYTVGHSAKNTSGRNTKQGQIAKAFLFVN
jgi:hypothetical protein